MALAALHVSDTYNNEFKGSLFSHPSKISSIIFADCSEEDSPGRHVETHSKGLSGKQCLHQTLPKQDLNRLFDDWQKTWVIRGSVDTMHYYSPLLYLQNSSVKVAKNTF